MTARLIRRGLVLLAVVAAFATPAQVASGEPGWRELWVARYDAGGDELPSTSR